MRETPGSHPAKEPPTDPLEERVKMTPDIRLEFRVNVKAGPQDIGVAFLQKSRAAIEDLVHRPLASMSDVEHRHAVRLHERAAPRARRHHRSLQRDRSGRHAEPPADLRLPPERAGRTRRRAPARFSRSLVRPCLPPPRGRTPISQSLMRFYQEERSNTGRFEAGIEMALRRILADPEFVFRFEPPPAAMRARRPVSHHRPAARLAAVLLPLVQRSRR